MRIAAGQDVFAIAAAPDGVGPGVGVVIHERSSVTIGGSVFKRPVQDVTAEKCHIAGLHHARNFPVMEPIGDGL